MANEAPQIPAQPKPLGLPVVQPVPIPDAAGFNPLNGGGIPHRLDKIAAMPSGVTIVEPYHERGSGESHEQVITYDVPFSKRQAFLNWLIGYSFTTPLGGEFNTQDVPIFLPNGNFVIYKQPIAALSRVIPAQSPTLPELYAAEYDLIGSGAFATNSPNSAAMDANGIALLDADLNPVVIPMIHYAGREVVGGGRFDEFFDGKARYSVTFRPRKYRIRTDAEAEQQVDGELCRYIERSRSYSLSGLPVNKLTAAGGIQQLQFIAGPQGIKGTPIPEGGVLPIMCSRLCYLWRQVPEVPWGAIENALGKVNAADFDVAGGVINAQDVPVQANPPRLGWIGYPRGTLLMEPPEIEEITMITGRVGFNIRYYFTLRPFGHNSFPAANGLFYPASFNGAIDNNGGPANPLFQFYDFTTLFKVPTPTLWQ